MKIIRILSASLLILFSPVACRANGNFSNISFDGADVVPGVLEIIWDALSSGMDSTIDAMDKSKTIGKSGYTGIRRNLAWPAIASTIIEILNKRFKSDLLSKSSFLVRNLGMLDAEKVRELGLSVKSALTLLFYLFPVDLKSFFDTNKDNLGIIKMRKFEGDVSGLQLSLTKMVDLFLENRVIFFGSNVSFDSQKYAELKKDPDFHAAFNSLVYSLVSEAGVYSAVEYARSKGILGSGSLRDELMLDSTVALKNVLLPAVLYRFKFGADMPLDYFVQTFKNYCIRTFMLLFANRDEANSNSLQRDISIRLCENDGLTDKPAGMFYSTRSLLANMISDIVITFAGGEDARNARNVVNKTRTLMYNSEQYPSAFRNNLYGISSIISANENEVRIRNVGKEINKREAKIAKLEAAAKSLNFKDKDDVDGMMQGISALLASTFESPILQKELASLREEQKGLLNAQKAITDQAKHEKSVVENRLKELETEKTKLERVARYRVTHLSK